MTKSWMSPTVSSEYDLAKMLSKTYYETLDKAVEELAKLNSEVTFEARFNTTAFSYALLNGNINVLAAIINANKFDINNYIDTYKFYGAPFNFSDSDIKFVKVLLNARPIIGEVIGDNDMFQHIIAIRQDLSSPWLNRKTGLSKACELKIIDVVTRLIRWSGKNKDEKK